MTELTIIHSPLAHSHGEHDVPLVAHRATLLKRRWRGTAEDGREFGFDLAEPLAHGTAFFANGTTRYVLEQAPEEVLEIAVGSAEEAARVAWNLGNLHFGIQVLPHAVRVTEDPAVLQFLEREKIAFKKWICVFLPLSPGAPHHHAHAHDHHHHD